METQTEMQSQPQTQSENAMDRFIRKTRELFAKEPDLDKRWNCAAADSGGTVGRSAKSSRRRRNGRIAFPPTAAPKICCSTKIRIMALRSMDSPKARRATASRARIHDHAHIYTLYGVLDGRERVVRYDRLDDRSKPDYAEIRESSNVLVGPGEIDLVKPYEIHTELTVGERTVAVIIRSQKGGDFNQGRYIPEKNEYYESLGHGRLPVRCCRETRD